jgi:GntR family transcriptional regulator
VTSFVPRYYEIEQALRARIEALEPGAPLPSDAELCEEFAVSRMTARQAVQRLAQEGLLERVPGRGTFVAEPPAHRQAGSLLNFSTEMRRRHRKPGSRVLARELRPATPDEVGRLKLKPGANVVVVRRLRLADGVPVAVETAVLRESCADAVLAADLEAGSLHASLVAAGFVPTRGRGTLDAEPATPADAALLQVAEGSALLVERRLILDQRGRPLESTESRYAGDRYALDIEFDVEKPRAR